MGAGYRCHLIWLSVVNKINSLHTAFASGYALSYFQSISRGGTCKRRLIILIYAGWIPPDLSSSRSCLCLQAGIRQALSHRWNEDSPHVVAPLLMPWMLLIGHHTSTTMDCHSKLLARYRHFFCYCPHEGSQFSCYCRHGIVMVFPSRHEPSESSTKPYLTFPGNIPDGLSQSFLT